MLIAFSRDYQNLKLILLSLSKERLNRKQKKILHYLYNTKIIINVTNLVHKLSIELNCSKSALWNNLNSLKKYGLINYSSLHNKGLPVKLTSIGKIISKELEEDKNDTKIRN